jgi:hypothetical protein
MSTFTHAFYIDESGKGGITQDLNHFWVTAAVLVPLEKTKSMDRLVHGLLEDQLRPGCSELHATDIPHRLKPGCTTSSFGAEVGEILREIDARIWVTCSRYGAPPLGNLHPGTPAKSVARQLLFERLNGYLENIHQSGDCLIIWDISDQQELADFSRDVVQFRNPVNAMTISTKLAPAVLGGLSHDWSGLQLADIISNFGLHLLAKKTSQFKFQSQKADVFRAQFLPLLMRSKGGKVDGFGWKEWL